MTVTTVGDCLTARGYLDTVLPQPSPAPCLIATRLSPQLAACVLASQNPGRLQDVLPSCGRKVVELRWVLCSMEGAVVFMELQRAAGLHHLCQCIWRSQPRIRIKGIAGPKGLGWILQHFLVVGPRTGDSVSLCLNLPTWGGWR